MWATAQLATQITTTNNTKFFFFTVTAGIIPEVGLDAPPHAIQSDTADKSVEGEYVVLRNISIGRAPFATIIIDGVTVLLVMLPAEDADRLWTATVAGVPTVMLTQAGGNADEGSREMILTSDAEQSTVHLLTSMDHAMFWACPHFTTLLRDGSAVPSTTDGVFEQYQITQVLVSELDEPQLRQDVCKRIQSHKKHRSQRWENGLQQLSMNSLFLSLETFRKIRQN